MADRVFPIPALLLAGKPHQIRGYKCVAATTGCLVAVRTSLLPAAAVAFAPARSVRRRLGVTKGQTDLQEEERTVNS